MGADRGEQPAAPGTNGSGGARRRTWPPSAFTGTYSSTLDAHAPVAPLPQPPAQPRSSGSVPAPSGSPGASGEPPRGVDPFSLPDDPEVAPPVTVVDLPEDRILRRQAEQPPRGWRRAVFRASGGLVRPQASRSEQDVRDLVELARQPVRGCRTVAVISTKGGVGKTSTTVNLGHTLATFRGDRVVALDANPDAGSLGYRVPRETSATALDLLEAADSITRYTDIRRFTSQASSRLEVVASPDDPRMSRSLGRDDYQRLLRVLGQHYTVVLADCGTGILDSATRGVVQAADQLLVVTGPSLDAARAVTFLLAWLAEHGLRRLVDEAVVVVNAVRSKRGMVDLSELERHFSGLVRATVQIPWDRELATGAYIDLDLLAPATRDAYVQLAAAVAGGFAVTEASSPHAV